MAEVPDEAAARRVSVGAKLHGAADLAFAALYAWLGFVVAPSRWRWWNATLAVVVALLLVAGIGLIARAGWARKLAIATHAALLLVGAIAIALLVASAAYLRGVYGPIGEGLAGVSLVAAALLVELFGILPVVQLRFLLREDVARTLRRDGSSRSVAAAP